MPLNVGTMDRALRTVIGLYLLAFATGFGFPPSGINWLGWFGLVPLATALVGFCPFYRLFGVSTAIGRQRQEQ